MMDFLETTVALLLLALAFWGFFTDPIGIGTREAVLPAFLAAFVFLHAISGLFWLQRNDEAQTPVTNATSGQQSGAARETTNTQAQVVQGAVDQPPSSGATPEQPSAISTNQDQASGTTEARDQPPATDAVVDQPSATRAVTEQTSAAEAIEGQSPATVGISSQLSAMSPTSGEQSSGITGPRDQLSASGSTDDRPSATEAITEQSPTTGTNSSEESPDTTGSRGGPKPSENTIRRFSDPKVCREILMCKMYDESLGPNSLSRVVSRAIPNQRLVHAFDIDNGFTTFDDQYRRDFLQDATKRLTSATKNGWKTIADQARDLVLEYVGKFARKRKPKCKLQYVVQVVALKVVFETFFGLNSESLEDHPMVRIAQGINDLWIESKSSPESQAGGVKRLKLPLKELQLEWTDQRKNPLNILLPVYETLWRVVAFCLIEVVFRPSAQAEWLGALKEFHKKPDDKGAFQARTKGGVSVEFLVKEALRLYPPTKRIYRRFEMRSTEGTETKETVAADIEACHRLPEIWGAESNKYRPARWNEANKGMFDAYMPFGGPPFTCPASGSFGPRMIGVLVAAIAPSISASDWQLELVGEASDCQGVLDDDTELNSKRSGGEQWVLIPKCQSDSGCENDG